MEEKSDGEKREINGGRIMYMGLINSSGRGAVLDDCIQVWFQMNFS